MISSKSIHIEANCSVMRSSSVPWRGVAGESTIRITVNNITARLLSQSVIKVWQVVSLIVEHILDCSCHAPLLSTFVGPRAE